MLIRKTKRKVRRRIRRVLVNFPSFVCKNLILIFQLFFIHTARDGVDHQNKDLAVYPLTKILTMMIPLDWKSIVSMKKIHHLTTTWMVSHSLLFVSFDCRKLSWKAWRILENANVVSVIIRQIKVRNCWLCAISHAHAVYANESASLGSIKCNHGLWNASTTSSKSNWRK